MNEERRLNMVRNRLWWLVVAGCLAAGCGGGAPKSQESGSPAVSQPGAIAVAVTEKGFEPAEITVRKGEPVTLIVTRKTQKTCATEFVMKSQAIHQALPLNEAVTITFTPKEAGELRYACGMDMIAGRVIVTE
jgi:plastocyanin domain-containing protein